MRPPPTSTVAMRDVRLVILHVDLRRKSELTIAQMLL
jgi:hypothetical protein